MIKKKICLVTGGAGFIGSNLANELAKNNKVIIIDNLATGHYRNIKHIEKKITFLKQDIAKITNSLTKIKKIDYVFHLAAFTSVQESLKKPKKYFKNNIDNTLLLIQELKRYKIKKFVYIASASCYGNNNNILTEESPIKCLSPYAKSKWIAEQLSKKSCINLNIPFISMRLFNAYGPNSDLSSEYVGVIGKFIYNKLNRQPLNIFGSGKQTRSFVHVDDVVKALILAAKSQYKNETYNVAGKTSVSINKIASFFKSKVIYKKERKSEVKISRSSLKKIKKELNYNISVNFSSGLKKLIQYYENK